MENNGERMELSDNSMVLAEDEDFTLPYTEPDFSALQQAYAQRPKTRKPLRREKIAAHYQDAFDLIGGVPRLALFAHEDPEAFYKQYARLILAEAKNTFDGEIRIIGFVQPTSLDGQDPIEGELA